MTNEEAINILAGLKELNGVNQGLMLIDDFDIEALDMAIEALENERPRGKWIKHNSYYRKCDQCNRMVGFDFVDPECGVEFNFCPNCGADMREADNETTIY